MAIKQDISSLTIRKFVFQGKAVIRVHSTMYEPIVLKKKLPRTITGTPAAKFSAVVNLTKIIVPICCTLLFCDYFINKKKLIAELDEYDFIHRKLTLFEEYLWTKDLWGHPMLRDTLQTVFQRQKENDKLLQIGCGMTLSEICEEKK